MKLAKTCFISAVAAGATLSTMAVTPQSEQKSKSVEFRVDAAKLPEMAQWAEKNVRRPVEKWAGNVVALLDGKDATWTNGVVELVLETGEGGNVAPAWACGGNIPQHEMGDVVSARSRWRVRA